MKGEVAVDQIGKIPLRAPVEYQEERTYKIKYVGGIWFDFPYRVIDPEGLHVGVYAFLWWAKRGIKKHKRQVARGSRRKTGVVYTEPATERFGEHLLNSKRLPGEVNFPGPEA